MASMVPGTVGKHSTVAQRLKDQGIDKNLADRARRAAALPEKKFEAEVERAVRTAVVAVEGGTAIIRGARAANPICRCLPRHPRAAALQRRAKLGNCGARDARCPWGAGRAGTGPSGGCVGYGPDSRYDAALRYVKSWAKS
jgi:hypothetical protein